MDNNDASPKILLTSQQADEVSPQNFPLLRNDQFSGVPHAGSSSEASFEVFASTRNKIISNNIWSTSFDLAKSGSKTKLTGKNLLGQMLIRLIISLIFLFMVNTQVSATIDLGNNVQHIPSGTNLGIGTTSPNAKLQINGSFMFKDGNQSNGYVLTSDANGLASWVATGSASTLNGLTSDQFLRSDSSDSFTSGTLTMDAGTTVDIDSTTLKIADTNITFDGASTTFTQTTGAFTLAPAAGSNLNVSLSGAGDFAINTNGLYLDTSAKNIGIGTTTPSAKLQINGTVMIVDGNQSNGYVLTSDANGLASWAAATTDSSTLNGFTSDQFLRSDSSDSFTSGTLTMDAGTTVDIDSTTLKIADTNITFDGASTTFTQTTGAFSLAPAAGSNLNVSLSGTGDFAVNTNQLYVDTSATNVGIGTSTPSAKLDLVGTFQYTDGNQSAGYVLTTDASGNATWQAAAASGASNIDELSDGKSNATDVFLGTGSGAAWTSAATYNTAVGINALAANTTGGNSNIAIGYNAADSITTGDYNIAIGPNALQAASTSSDNIAIGYNAGDAITGGTANTLIGKEAGGAITSGNYNTALGWGAMDAITDSVDNVAIGLNALTSYTAANGKNVAVGRSALASNTSGYENTAVGAYAMETQSSGYRNTALGYYSMYAASGNSNTAVGNYSLRGSTGSNNTGMGYYSMESNTSGTYNTALGSNSLDNTTTGSYNTALGGSAMGLASTTSKNNVALGYQAGYASGIKDNGTYLGYKAGTAITTGDNNITIGYQAGDNITTGSSNLIIGYDNDAVSATASNQLDIANTIYGDTSAGNVGIGTSTISATLDLVGTFQYTDGNQANGYVLTSDASGNATWQAAAAGGASAIDELSDASTTVNSISLGTGAAGTAGTSNTTTGINAGTAIISGGNYNVAVGHTALDSTTTGDNNTAVGYASNFS